jgi:hypothetical protein
VRRWSYRGRSWTSPDCGSPVRRSLHAPSPMRRWRQSRRRRCSRRRSCTSGRAARFPPCRRFTAAHTRSLPRARRCSDCRWASGKRRSPLTALSRTVWPLQSSQRSRQQEAGRKLADFSSHPLPQGLVLARGPVAEQMHECIDVKNPPNCVGGIHVFICVSFLASLLLALLLNTSSQFYTVAYYLPGLPQK